MQLLYDDHNTARVVEYAGGPVVIFCRSTDLFGSQYWKELASYPPSSEAAATIRHILKSLEDKKKPKDN